MISPSDHRGPLMFGRTERDRTLHADRSQQTTLKKNSDCTDQDFALSIKELFEEEYLSSSPYLDYIVGCGLSKFSVYVSEKKPSDSPEDWLIVVFLKSPLPKTLRIPDVYKGVRLIKELAGEID